MNRIWIEVITLLFAVIFLSCSKEEIDSPNNNTVEMYATHHGNTDLAGMHVFLNEDNEFCGTSGMRISPLGKQKSLQDTDISFFYTDFRTQAKVGNYYAAAPYEYMFCHAGDYCAIPINEKYLVFTPTSPIVENGITIGYRVEYEIRTAHDYNLPEWWSTVAIIEKGKTEEAVITLPSTDCEVYTNESQIILDKAGDRLKISLSEYADNENLTGKIELFLRIKESYSLVYVEIR